MPLEAHSLIGWLVIGLIAGAVAGRVVEGGGFGILGDIVVGLVGAFIGGLIFNALNIQTSWTFLGSLVVAFIGAVALLLVLRLLTGGRRGGRRAAWRRWRTPRY